MRRTGQPRCGRLTQNPSLSVIIPARNEEQYLQGTLEKLQGTDAQVIVVDGRSCDRTLQVARDHGATVVSAPPGRGMQLRCGAAIATGEILLLLHADTSLPEGFEDHVFSILQRPHVVAGAFQLRISAPQPAFRLIEQCVHWRSRAAQMPYGDQALFLKAQTLQRIGGIRDLPSMEDFELVRRLRRVGRIEVAPVAVVTSARRWQERGIWRTTLNNQLCVAAYLMGISPCQITQWRAGARRSAAPAPVGNRHVETPVPRTPSHVPLYP